MIAQGMYAVRVLDPTKPATMVEKSSDDIPRTSSYNLQSSSDQSFISSLSRLCCICYGKTSLERHETHKSQSFSTQMRLQKPALPKSLLTSSSLVAQIVTFTGLKTDTTTNEDKYSIAYASKEPMDTLKSPTMIARCHRALKTLGVKKHLVRSCLNAVRKISTVRV